MMTKKCYNLFSKDFWNRENLKVDFTEAKKGFEEAKIKYAQSKERTRKLLEFGEKLRKFGTRATLGLTLPIILTIFLGGWGLLIGGLLFLGILGRMFTQKKKGDDYHERQEINFTGSK